MDTKPSELLEYVEKYVTELIMRRVCEASCNGFLIL